MMNNQVKPINIKLKYFNNEEDQEEEDTITEH